MGTHRWNSSFSHVLALGGEKSREEYKNRHLTHSKGRVRALPCSENGHGKGTYSTEVPAGVSYLFFPSTLPGESPPTGRPRRDAVCWQRRESGIQKKIVLPPGRNTSASISFILLFQSYVIKCRAMLPSLRRRSATNRITNNS